MLATSYTVTCDECGNTVQSDNPNPENWVSVPASVFLANRNGVSLPAYDFDSQSCFQTKMQALYASQDTTDQLVQFGIPADPPTA